jgi:hypothetical protein
MTEKLLLYEGMEIMWKLYGGDDKLRVCRTLGL